jgi:hypothetical protein
LAASSLAQEERHPVNSALAVYDDPAVAEPGELSIGEYISYTTLQAGSLISGPGIDVTIGLFRRVELEGFSGVQFSRDTGTYIYGSDDSYLGVKVMLLSQGAHRPGIAVKPTLEILGEVGEADPLFTPSRKNLVVPIIVGRRFESWALSYTGGYVTRGLAFSSVKWELNRWDRVTPIAVIYGSRATRELRTLDELGLNRSQLDVSLGVVAAVSANWNISVEGSRTVGRVDENSSRLGLSIGLEFTGRLWGKPARSFKASSSATRFSKREPCC